jgi:hypothetical protein
MRSLAAQVRAADDWLVDGTLCLLDYQVLRSASGAHRRADGHPRSSLRQPRATPHQPGATRLRISHPARRARPRGTVDGWAKPSPEASSVAGRKEMLRGGGTRGPAARGGPGGRRGGACDGSSGSGADQQHAAQLIAARRAELASTEASRRSPRTGSPSSPMRLQVRHRIGSRHPAPDQAAARHRSKSRCQCRRWWATARDPEPILAVFNRTGQCRFATRPSILKLEQSGYQSSSERQAQARANYRCWTAHKPQSQAAT